MKISRSIGYAVQATLDLAKADRTVPIPCSQLAARGKMPHRFLLQILRRLVANGVVCSTKGVAGGYSLARAPQQITLLQVVESLGNPFDPQLPEIPGVSASARAQLLASLERTTAIVRVQLHKLTLADLVDGRGLSSDWPHKESVATLN